MNLQRQNSTTPRDPRDFYPTPRGFIRSALDVLDDYLLESPKSILDPGAGTGAWGREARLKWQDSLIYGIDDYFEEPADSFTLSAPYTFWLKRDYLGNPLWRDNTFDLITGNPPYKVAEEFIRESLRVVKGGGIVAFLLRLEFVAGQERAGLKQKQKDAGGIQGLWKEFPPRSVNIIPRRISFTGNGKTDAFEYAFFIWQKGYKGITLLDWLDWNYLPGDMWARNGNRGHQPDVELSEGLGESAPEHSPQSGPQGDYDGTDGQAPTFVPVAPSEGL